MQTPFNVTVLRAPVRRSSLLPTTFSISNTGDDVCPPSGILTKEQRKVAKYAIAKERKPEPHNASRSCETETQTGNEIEAVKSVQYIKKYDKPLPEMPRQGTSTTSCARTARGSRTRVFETQQHTREFTDGRKQIYPSLRIMHDPIVLDQGPPHMPADLFESRTRFKGSRLAVTGTEISAGSATRGRLSRACSMNFDPQSQACQRSESSGQLRSRSIESPRRGRQGNVMAPDISGHPWYQSKIISSHLQTAGTGPTLRIAHDAHDLIMGTSQHRELDAMHMIDLGTRSQQPRSELHEAAAEDSRKGKVSQSRQTMLSSTSSLLENTQGDGLDMMGITALQNRVRCLESLDCTKSIDVPRTNVDETSRNQQFGLLRRSKSLHVAKPAKYTGSYREKSLQEKSDPMGFKSLAWSAIAHPERASDTPAAPSMEDKTLTLATCRSAGGLSLRCTAPAVDQAALALRKGSPSTFGKFGLPDLQELFHMRTREEKDRQASSRASQRSKISTIHTNDREKWRQRAAQDTPQFVIKENKLDSPSSYKKAHDLSTPVTVPSQPRADSTGPDGAHLDIPVELFYNSSMSTYCPAQREAFRELHGQLMLLTTRVEQASRAAQKAAEHARAACDVTRRQVADIMRMLKPLFEEGIIGAG